ncbi:MAG: BspA family leucine-rich repeat surface protein [Paludibacteraceae bacterium]|nr:BspA family leucine-rich repeat surface protein [Paludibacteraceae bacterium]
MKRTLSFLLVLLAAVTMPMRAAEKQVYATLDKSTHTFTIYCDENRNSRSNVADSWTAENGTENMLKSDLKEIYTVVIDESLSHTWGWYSSYRQWFANMTNVTAFEHLDNLLRISITDMYRMFYKCERVPFLDLRFLYTGATSNMEEMFAGCKSLAVLDLSSFEVPVYTGTKRVTTKRMFADCTNLRVIFCGKDRVMYSVENGEGYSDEDMFLNCKKLVGGYGTAYDAKHIDGSYGRPDTKNNDKGYFTSVLKSTIPRTYALLSDDGEKLTIRCDYELGKNRGIADWSMYNNDGRNNPNYDHYAVKTIAIDETLRDTLLLSTSKWFYYFSSLTAIEHLDYLNTSEVKNMSYMFAYCKKLTSLDLSPLNTENVVSMNSMFEGCSGFTTLDVSGFNTQNAKAMSQMFAECKKLSSLDLSNFNTENVTSMEKMFYQDLALKNLNLSSFNTKNVTNMAEMFKSCPLSDIDLSGFDTRKVENMSGMFLHCQNLTSLDLTKFKFNRVEFVSNLFYGDINLQTIYCNEDLSKAPELFRSENLFGLCEKLTGGAGTAYDAEHASDVSYARVDAMGTPGYFTTTIEADEPEIYGKLSVDGSTLTIRYDKKRPVVSGVSDWSRYNNAPENEKAETNRVTKVVIDESMKEAKPVSTEGWFADYRFVKTITGLDLLNTSKTTSMKEMFARCDSLKDMSVSGFDTKNVTDMSCMFAGCGRLRTLDVSKFNTQNVTDMSYMFDGCKSLIAIKVDNFDTRKVQNMSHLFRGCIYASPLNVKNFNTESVTDMSYMFAGCAYETSLAVGGFNTQNVTNLSGMFDGCKNLRSVDMKGFDVSNVTDMSNMFRNDSALIVLYANKDWSKSSSLTASDNMFYGCPKLKGSAGTIYSEAHVDASYARPDGGSGDEGYFTVVAEIYAIWDADNTTLTLRYDDKREENGGTTNWALYNYLATKVVFDPSMKKAEPTSTKDWFYGFSQLETIEHLDYLSTYRVKDMSYMFSGCSKLTTINVNSFYLSWAETTEGMFSYCINLTTIWCDYNWNEQLYDKNSKDMFLGCTNLVGGKGTAYDANYTSSTRACTDSNLRYGYFTAMPTSGADLSGNELYAVLESDNKTLTIHYDKQRTSLGGSTDWYKYSSTSGYHITEVVFLQPVENAMPITTEDWFRNFSDLEQITGIEYLNTEYVTSMSGMFKNCSSLTSLDVTNFNTQNVTNMGFMFSDCSALTALDLSRFDMRKVTIMYNMFENCESLTELDIKEFDTREVTDMTMLFAGCKNLTELDVTKLNTSNVEDMMGMFYQCEKLTILDVSNFKMDNIKSLMGMFYGCKSLTTIWCNDDWSKLPQLTYHGDMFTECPALVGGNGTAYDEGNANDATFAHIDAKGNPGYFTTNLTCKVTLKADNGAIEVTEQDIDLDAVPMGSTLHLTAIPDNGFVLDSWTNYNGIELTVNEDIEVSAKFIVQTFTVKFVDWDDKVIDQQNVEWGKAPYIPDDPVREDYLFTGWNPAEFSNVYADMTIKAEYEPAAYKVTLIAENGKITIDEEVDLSKVPYGTLLSLTAEPDYGYVFDHWDNYNPDLSLYVSENITITAYFKPATFTLTAVAEPTEGGTFILGGVDENHQSTYMSDYTIEAIPKDGYEFVEWRDGDQVLDNKTTKMSGALYGDVTIVAVFKANKYTVSATVTPESAGVVKGQGEYPYNSFYTLTLEPAEGWELKEWRDGITLEEETNTLEGLVYGNVNIEVVLQKKHYTINTAVNDEKMGSVTGAGSYEHGSEVTLTATANSGYRFVKWNTGATDNPLVFTANDNSIVTAIFEALPEYTLTVVASPAEGGQVIGSGTYKEGEEVQLAASANTGYNFVEWKEDGDKNAIRKVKVTADATYTALFEKQQAPKPEYTITVVASPAEGGQVFGAGTYEEGKQVQLIAVAATGYDFVQWNDGLTEPVRTITVNANATYTAEFKKQEVKPNEFTITVYVAPEGSGTVEGTGKYEEGKTATLVALPAEGYEFLQWSDGVKDNPRTITVTENLTLIASFKKKTVEPDEFTVTVVANPAVGGQVIGAGTYKKGATATLVAIAAEGYEFKNWSDGSTDNPHAIVVEKDLTLIANFDKVEVKPNEFTISVYVTPNGSGTVEGAGTYEQGQTATLVALPAEGYEFREWSDGNTDNPREIVVNKNLTLICNFHKIGEGVEDVEGSLLNGTVPKKVLRDGHIVIILPDGREFDATGVKMK